MTELEKLEKRWKELVGRPRTKEELEESVLLVEKMNIELSKEYLGLLAELHDIRIQITDIWNLVNTNRKYPEAIPLLLKYLPMVKHLKNKEGIIRSLTVPEAKGIAVPLLLKEYYNTPKEKHNLRWVIGNAVNVTITKNNVADIIPLVLDKENGSSRQMFVAALGKIKTEEVKEVLLELINDEDKIIRDMAEKSLKKVSKGKAS
ncbi:HEAT repeat domain-containing protein [Sphingobacterium spiritivorum]|uniref:HEAT repeat domain-containing protein n=1 Tax=Sphingobacterium spiritivorum TaxID=258 RepID=UPI00191925B9|nr:HEAT repeat domain-containing protein [Sphingobacterium spiritivorum]QQT26039.1 hypothetical protein I6J02_20425 [Sphingobacterium spiritivorum]